MTSVVKSLGGSQLVIKKYTRKSKFGNEKLTALKKKNPRISSASIGARKANKFMFIFDSLSGVMSHTKSGVGLAGAEGFIHRLG